eukprot:3941755-Rhodomonas_salina.2
MGLPGTAAYRRGHRRKGTSNPAMLLRDIRYAVTRYPLCCYARTTRCPLCCYAHATRCLVCCYACPTESLVCCYGSAMESPVLRLDIVVPGSVSGGGGGGCPRPRGRPGTRAPLSPTHFLRNVRC